MKNDLNREPFNCVHDTRLTFIPCLNKWKPHQHPPAHVLRGLPALHLTLNDMAALIPGLLTKMMYVLTAELQTDRHEGEFGIYRKSSGGNYHISALQVFNGLSFQRLKLFHELDVQKQSVRVTGQCCSVALTDEELDLIDKCFENADCN